MQPLIVPTGKVVMTFRQTTIICITTQLVCLGVLGVGCRPVDQGGDVFPPDVSSKPQPTPSGFVDFQEGTVRAPGSTLVTEGQEFAEEVPLTGDSLIGVVREGRAYLYHPALGRTDLSDYTSRRALGYFLASSTASSLVSTKAARQQLAVGEDRDLDTGLGVVRTGQTTYQFRNHKKRWAAVLSPAEEKAVFLEPRGSLIEINIVGGLAGLQDFITVLDQDVAEVEVNAEPVQTYGAIVRLAPILVSSPVSALLYRDLYLQKAQEGLTHNSDLFLKLNAIEFLQMTAEAISQVIGLDPEACSEALVKGAFLDSFETAGVGLLTGDTELIATFTASAAQDLSVDYGFCACEAVGAAGTAGAGTVACIVVDEILDIVALVNWIVDDVLVGAADAFSASAFAEIDGITNRAPIADDQFVHVTCNTAKDILLTGRDPDSGPTPLTFRILSNPLHGSLSGSPPNVTYTPSGECPGSDSFKFTVNDGAVDSNVATVTLTVLEISTLPNLKPTRPFTTWSDKIVVSHYTGTTQDDPVLSSDYQVYVDWAWTNEGPGDAGPFKVRLLVDGHPTEPPAERSPSSLAAGSSSFEADTNIGRLATGTHTLKVVVDADSQVTETNESDNEYSKTIIVIGGVLANAGSDKSISCGGSEVLEGSATGGIPPYTYTWSPASGLDDPHVQRPTATTCTPTTYTLTVRDALGAQSSDSMNLSVGGWITVTTPLAGASFPKGTGTVVSNWTSSGVGGAVRIDLVNTQGAMVRSLESNYSNSGSYSMSLGPQLEYYLVPQSGLRIRVTDSGNAAIFGLSPASFSITGSTPSDRLVLNNPNGGETVRNGQTYTIRWESYGNVGDTLNIVIYKAGLSIAPIYAPGGAYPPNTGELSWTVGDVSGRPLAPGSDYQLRISSLSNGQILDFSDAFFSISN